MIVTKSMQFNYAGEFAAFKAFAKKALASQRFDPDSATWHLTRRVEWPWAWQHIHPTDVLLDIGTDPMFAAATIERFGELLYTWHHTHVDMDGIGRHYMCPEVRFGDIWKRNSRRVTGLIGLPEDLAGMMQPAQFSKILLLSVIEHVPQADAKSWFDALHYLLQPKGQLVVTMDWLIGQGVGGGVDGETSNLDLSFIEDRWRVVEHVIGGGSCPWPWEDEVDMMHEDVFRVPWIDGTHLGVFGFVLERRR